ncbi:hypothetical protein [Amycolatopsis keratiniphila]|uniref:hypothetical protein n=1 Tax=Amycolatopsis keratiniphila TaxID=129921 RepID=UPI00087AC5CF|nr:hypothetical protein [Amycolatopsis keratiniphila]SDU67001.1 hypothetical protein SAMN04489733_8045 [Amycolatopsis keratiniphila]
MTITHNHLTSRCGLCTSPVTALRLTAGGQRACATCVAPMQVCDYCDLPTAAAAPADDYGDLCVVCTNTLGLYPCDECPTLIGHGDTCTVHSALRPPAFTCDHCRTRRTGETASLATQERELCNACVGYFHVCEDCNLFDEYSTAVDSSDSPQAFCYSCARDHDYYECLSCERLIDQGDYCVNHIDHAAYDAIHDYYFKPEPIFHGTGPRYLGMELEINVPRGQLAECIDDATGALGELGYLKQDESIARGFELVTHPMSYRWALESFPWHLLDNLQAKGCTGDDIGLHVHISRAAFVNSFHVYRWMKFVYRNASDVQTLARRQSSYAAFDDHERVMVKETCKGERIPQRTLAINTQPEDTLELRVFASSLDIGQVQAALAFADASVSYTRDLTISDLAQRGAWNWDSFTRWILTRPKYSPLTRELENLACAC